MQENTKTDEIAKAIIPPYVWIVLAIFTVFVYFFGLTIPFLGPDEARYAQVAREMMDRGDWITPTLGGFHWFEKPALLYWLEIASFRLLGVSEFAARFGPAMFGIGTTASLWILGRSIGNDVARSADDEQPVASGFANYLALTTASTLGIIVFARGASFDIIITFPLTAAMVSFFIFERNEFAGRPKYFPLILFYVFVGIALLAKGLIGILFPFAIVGFYYVLSMRLPSRRLLISLIWGTGISVVIALIWYLPMYRAHGYEFIDQFFVQHHFQRFTSNKYQHPQPFYFYLWVLPLMTLPWLPLFFGGIWQTLRGRLDRRSEDTLRPQARPSNFSPLLRFTAAWLIVPVVFFSISGSKLPGYILPAVPAAVLIAAAFGFERFQRSRRWRLATILTATFTLSFVVLLLTFVVPRFAETDSVKGLMQAANSKGYGSSKVLMLHNISHNAEFYAAGRLKRGNNGAQIRLSGVDDVLTVLEAESGNPVLVLVPLEYLNQLTNDRRIKTELLSDNTELAITAVSKK